MRIVGLDIHRVFAEAVMLDGGVVKRLGRIGLTRDHLEAFARSLTHDDPVVVEATGNANAVADVIAPHVGRVVIANPCEIAKRFARPSADDRTCQDQDRRHRRGGVGQAACQQRPAGVRPALHAKKLRDLELRSGQPARRGQRGSSYDDNLTRTRLEEKRRAEQAEVA